MYPSGSNSAINAYQQLNTEGNVEVADSHGLISMLFNALLLKLKIVRGYIDKQQVNEKVLVVNKCLDILDGLRSSLNKEDGGEIAENLDDIYDYMQRRLVEANMQNDNRIVSEVESLLKEISEAWELIPAEARK